MRNNWWLMKGAMSPEWCDEVIRRGKDKPLTQAGIFSNNETSEIRETQVSWIDDADALDIAWKIISRANKEFFQFHVTDLPALQFGIYGQDAFYNWHHDVDFLRDDMADRKLSICIQLSDASEYEGGKFEFQDYPQPDYTDKGDVIVFPSFHTHRVNKITKGTRYSLVGWAEGPRWN